VVVGHGSLVRAVAVELTANTPTNYTNSPLPVSGVHRITRPLHPNTNTADWATHIRRRPNLDRVPMGEITHCREIVLN
jgi:phosphohistidine phosphatase SixA